MEIAKNTCDNAAAVGLVKFGECLELLMCVKE